MKLLDKDKLLVTGQIIRVTSKETGKSEDFLVGNINPQAGVCNCCEKFSTHGLEELEKHEDKYQEIKVIDRVYSIRDLKKLSDDYRKFKAMGSQIVFDPCFDARDSFLDWIVENEKNKSEPEIIQEGYVYE